MSGRLIKRIEALLCTGSPGLYRLVTFFSVQHIYSLADLGHVAMSMSIAQMVGFFTAIGWATLILVRLPGLDEKQGAVDTFYPLVSMAGMTTLAITCVAIVLLRSGLIDFDILGFLPILWGWTAYQIGRHYFVARKRYRTAVIFDLMLMATSGMLLLTWKQYHMSSSYALASALGITAVVMFMTIGLPSRGTLLGGFDVKGLQFGLTNFLSGGISLVFVPAATLMCSASFGGMLSLLGSVTAVGILIPRAISMAQLPELARRKLKGLPVDSTLQGMQRSIGWSNGVVLVVNAIVVVGATVWRVHDNGERAVLILAGFLLAIQCAVGMMGIVGSSVMMAFERGGDAAKINVATTGIFAALCAICIWHGGQTGFLMMLTSAITVTCLRNWFVCLRAVHVRRQYAIQTQHGSAYELRTVSAKQGPSR